MWQKISTKTSIMIIAVTVCILLSSIMPIKAESLVTSYLKQDNKVVETINNQEQDANISLFKDALNEFGATSPILAAKLWAKGIKTRNGALQYAVMCSQLKVEFEKSLPYAPSWVTGVSSPWVSKYEIVGSKRINDTSYEYKIKFYWATSSGESEPTVSTLTIAKEKGIWCICKIK